MKKFVFALFAMVLMAHSALALDLAEAKSKGLVKELPTGYLTAVDPSAKDLADGINVQRRAEYEKVAAKNKQPVDVVEKLMGAKLAR